MFQWVRDLKHRRRQPELMDDPALAAPEHHAALRGLERINRLSLSVHRIWRPIRPLAAACTGRPLRILDIATGAGDIPIGLGRSASRAGIAVQLTGCDVSGQAIEYARRRAADARCEARFIALDALHDDLPDDQDVITSSLFLHHLDEADILTLLMRMKAAARRMIVISDLDRRPMGYAMAVAVTRCLTHSRIVHVDGPLSVAGALSLKEIRGLSQQAGLDGAEIHRIFPWRWRLIWRRGAA